MLKPSSALSKIKIELESLGLLPKEIELSPFSDFYFSNILLKEHLSVISESVVCGFDRDPEFAVLKSFSEYIEALSFQKGAAIGLASCKTERSDGFAAFPTFEINHKATARDNAFAEAVERYVWSTWWDQPDIKFQTETVQATEHRLLLELSGIIELESVVLVKPEFLPRQDLELCIYIAFLSDGGVISGGACGRRGHNEARAMSELVRHGLAAQKFKSSQAAPRTFYEQRLSFFLSDDGEALVRTKLEKPGTSAVRLPKLLIDTEVPSVAPESFYVHRCLFEDQPPFVGGDLKRFCL